MSSDSVCKIVLSLCGHSILFITCIVTDRTEFHSFLLPFLINNCFVNFMPVDWHFYIITSLVVEHNGTQAN